MPEVEIASSLYSQKPEQKLAVADVYSKTGSEAINSFQNLRFSSEEIKEKFSLLSKYASADKLKLLKGFDIKNGLTVDKDGVIGRISSALSDSAGKAKSFLKDMAEKKDAAMAFYIENKNKVTGLINDAQSVYYKVGNVYQAVSNVNLTDLRSVTRAINSMSSATNAIGLNTDGAIGGIYASLVDEASELGIPDAFNTVADTIYESQEIYNKGQAIYQLATDTLPNAISRGDIRMVGSIADRLGSGSVSSMRPDAVRSISANNYGFHDTRNTKEIYDDYRGKYRSMEPNWDVSVWQPMEWSGNTEGTKVRDVSAVISGTDHTRDVFINGGIRSEASEDKIFAILDNVGYRSVDNEITKRLPYSTAVGLPQPVGFSTSPLGY